MIVHYVEVALVFVTILSVLVAAHEFGHYIFARLFGMGVEEFSIGMGGSKPLFTYLNKTYRIPLTDEEVARVQEMTENGESQTVSSSENVPSSLMKLESATNKVNLNLVQTPTGPVLEESTVFTFRPYPVGGFVRIKGMLPQEDGSETSIPGGFYSKAPWKRLIVLLAGPVFSILAGVLVMIPLFMAIGMIKPDQDPVLGTVVLGPASKAGLQANDRILTIDGRSIHSFYEVVTKIQTSAGVPLQIDYRRGNQTFHTVLTPVMSDTPMSVLGPDLLPTGELSRHPMMGASAITKLAKASFREAVFAAMRTPVMTVNGLLGAIKHPSTGKSVVGGPGTMIKATSDAVDSGVLAILDIAAEISISVGIFNLLPIFPLDGGQMAVAIAEMFRGGRRLSMKVQNTVGVVGLATVGLLVCFVLTVDFGRLTKPEAPLKVISQQKLEK